MTISNLFLQFLSKKKGRSTFAFYKTSAYIFILVFVFLFFLKPFVIYKYSLSAQLIFCLGISCCVSLGHIFSAIVTRIKTKQKWTNLDHSIFILFIVVSVWLLVNLFFAMFNTSLFFEFIGTKDQPVIDDYFLVKSIIYVVGMFCIIYPIFHLLGVKNQFESLKVLLKEDSILIDTLLIKSSKVLIIKGKNKDEYLKILEINFIYAKCEGHYLKIYYLCPKIKVQKNYLIRRAITCVEKDVLKKHPSIYRCHKSYLINLDRIKNLEKVNDRTFVILEKNSEKIPISKNRENFVKKTFKRKDV